MELEKLSKAELEALQVAKEQEYQDAIRALAVVEIDTRGLVLVSSFHPSNLRSMSQRGYSMSAIIGFIMRPPCISGNLNTIY